MKRQMSNEEQKLLEQTFDEVNDKLDLRVLLDSICRLWPEGIYQKLCQVWCFDLKIRMV